MKMKCYEINDKQKKRAEKNENDSDGEKMKFDDSIHVSNKYQINRARNKNQISRVEKEDGKKMWTANETTTTTTKKESNNNSNYELILDVQNLAIILSRLNQNTTNSVFQRFIFFSRTFYYCYLAFLLYLAVQ